MTDLPFTMVNFPSGTTYPPSPLRVSWLNLIWSAVTVGATPLAAGGTRRPFLEMVWRASVVSANLKSSPGGWMKSDAYKRLDPSEKSAVSYFLGMTQAKLTSAMILNVPILVHLDAILVQKGIPLSGSRPDFIGMNVNGTLAPLVLEAKGRTHGWTTHLATTAKTQAQLIPAALVTPAASTSLAVSSIAYFEDYIWQARLEDPPVKNEKEVSIDSGELAHLYYAPIVRALLDARKYAGATAENAEVGVDSNEGVESRVEVEIPGADMWLSLPLEILTIVQGVDGGLQTAKAAGDAIIGYVREVRNSQIKGSLARGAGGFSYENVVSYVGLDCVGVRIGESWLEQGE